MNRKLWDGVLNDTQINILDALFRHSYFNHHQHQTCTHGEQKVQFGVLLEWADREGVPWILQNVVAGKAEKRENNERYFSEILSEVMQECQAVLEKIAAANKTMLTNPESEV